MPKLAWFCCCSSYEDCYGVNACGGSKESGCCIGIYTGIIML